MLSPWLHVYTFDTKAALIRKATSSSVHVLYFVSPDILQGRNNLGLLLIVFCWDKWNTKYSWLFPRLGWNKSDLYTRCTATYGYFKELNDSPEISSRKEFTRKGVKYNNEQRTQHAQLGKLSKHRFTVVNASGLTSKLIKDEVEKLQESLRKLKLPIDVWIFESWTSNKIRVGKFSWIAF